MTKRDHVMIHPRLNTRKYKVAYRSTDLRGAVVAALLLAKSLPRMSSFLQSILSCCGSRDKEIGEVSLGRVGK